MFLKLATSICVSFLMVSISWAQCSAECNGCNECGGDGVYQSVVEDGDCGHASDWDDEFFSCCRKSRFQFKVCDPCCSKPYFSVFGGANSVENFYRELTTGPTTVDQEGADFLDGYIAGTAVGFRVHHHLRFEAEYSYRYNQADTWFTATETNGIRTAFAQVPATGRINSHAGMFNAIYDFSERRVRCANLYAGGGIGIVTIDADITAAGNNYTSDDSQFAFQFIGGVNVPLSKAIETFAEYRFLSADALDVYDATAGAPFGDFDYQNHSIVFGVRLNR